SHTKFSPCKISAVRSVLPSSKATTPSAKRDTLIKYSGRSFSPLRTGKRTIKRGDICAQCFVATEKRHQDAHKSVENKRQRLLTLCLKLAVVRRFGQVTLSRPPPIQNRSSGPPILVASSAVSNGKQALESVH